MTKTGQAKCQKMHLTDWEKGWISAANSTTIAQDRANSIYSRTKLVPKVQRGACQSAKILRGRAHREALWDPTQSVVQTPGQLPFSSARIVLDWSSSRDTWVMMDDGSIETLVGALAASGGRKISVKRHKPNAAVVQDGSHSPLPCAPCCCHYSHIVTEPLALGDSGHPRAHCSLSDAACNSRVRKLPLRS